MSAAASLIAVLLPVYEPGPELVATLDSIKRQTVPFRLYVIDDGSRNKPDYPSLLDGLDYRLIESPRNLGVNEARNPALQAILEAGHELIALIDCGDVMRPERLQVQRDFLAAHPEIAILGSQAELAVVQNDTCIVSRHPHEHDDIVTGLWIGLPLTHPALMLRARVYRHIGLYSPRFEAAEDYDFCRRAALAGYRFHNLPDVLLRKVETASSISWRKRRRQLRSRLRIQWAYRRLGNRQCLKGLAKTSIIRLLPDGVALSLKRLLVRGRAAALTLSGVATSASDLHW
jgi:GT2 family glycosyltransferase